MAITWHTAGKRYYGLSTDEKPGHDGTTTAGTYQIPPLNSVFVEIDTGKRFIWTGSWPWVRQDQTIETLLGELIDTNRQILDTLNALARGQGEYLAQHGIEIEESLSVF